jgi:hypothetical protein
MRTASSLLFVLLIPIWQSSAFSAATSPTGSIHRRSTPLSAAADTPENLPTFENAEEYIKYLETVSDLPKGFATGTGEGTFVSVEAPSLGNLKIRATVIQLTEGPTDSWAATYTSNKVSLATMKNAAPSSSWIFVIHVFLFVFLSLVPRISCKGWQTTNGSRWPNSGLGHQ